MMTMTTTRATTTSASLCRWIAVAEAATMAATTIEAGMEMEVEMQMVKTYLVKGSREFLGEDQ